MAPKKILPTKKNSDPEKLPNDHLTTAGGNSETPAVNEKTSRNRGIFFTYNNYDQMTINFVKKLEFDKDCLWGIVGKEVGESGTPHLQGCLYFKNKKSWDNMRQLIGPGIHCEPMKGTKAQQKYCAKDGDIILKKNWDWDTSEDDWKIDDPFDTFIPTPMQQFILDKTTPYKEDRRGVWWIYDEKGNSGKTTLCLHYLSKYKSMLIDGRAEDIMYSLAALKKDGKPAPEYILLNLTRQQEGKLSYKAIEAIKDRAFFSRKYESGQILLRKSPTIIIFANCLPETRMLTQDRWNIIEVRDGVPLLLPQDSPALRGGDVRALGPWDIL